MKDIAPNVHKFKKKIAYIKYSPKKNRVSRSSGRRDESPPYPFTNRSAIANRSVFTTTVYTPAG